MNTLLISPFAYRVKPNNLHPGFNRLIDQYIAQDVIPAVKKTTSKITSPLTNIKKTADAYELLLNVPGYVKEQINITTEEDVLHIEGSIEETTANDVKYNYREFGLYNFKRSFRLPENVDYEKISAQCKDGILLVKIGLKVEETQKTAMNITIE